MPTGDALTLQSHRVTVPALASGSWAATSGKSIERQICGIRPVESLRRYRFSMYGPAMDPSKNDSPDRGAPTPRLTKLVPWVLTFLTVTCVFVALGTIYAIGGWTITLGGITIKAPIIASPTEPTLLDDARMAVDSVQLTATPDLLYYLLRAIAFLPGAAIFLYSLILMRSLVASVPAGESFTTANVSRIFRIGLVLAVGWPAAYLLGAIAIRILLAHEGVAERLVPTFNLATLVWPLLAGAVLLVLTVILSAGTRMRDDVEGLV